MQRKVNRLKMSDSDDIEMLESSGTKKPSSEVAPPEKKSDIWEYFKLKEEDGKKMAVCTKCPRKSFTFSGGTSTLWKHLKTVHFILPTRQTPQPQSDLTPQGSSKKTVVKQKSIEQAFARDTYICCCLSI